MKKGFTLIELLIVMGVITILIGIIIPSFRGMQEEAWRTRAEKECETMQVAVESYYKNWEAYPPNLASLASVTPRIINRVPTDPFQTWPIYIYGSGPAITVNTYTYATGTDITYGNWYMIGSRGPDRAWSAGTTYDPNTGTWFYSGDDIVVTNAIKRRN